LHNALIAPPFRSFQPILAVINAVHLKFSAWLNAVLSTDRCGQEDLSLARHDGRHDR
jgi:hypothetical protein